MVDFVSEVQEELRKDDYNKWLRQYGPYIAGLIVAVIMATAYLEFRKNRQDRDARATSAAYMDAISSADDGDLNQAVERFVAISEAAPEGYAGLSLMRAAGLELEQNNRTEAVRLLDKAAAEFSKPRHAQLAQIKAAYILADEGRYNDAKLRVSPLAVKDQPYEYLARELLGFAALQTGDVSEARKQFAYLETIPGVPESIQSRAKQYLTVMRTSITPEDDMASEDIAPEPITLETMPEDSNPKDSNEETNNEN